MAILLAATKAGVRIGDRALTTVVAEGKIPFLLQPLPPAPSKRDSSEGKKVGVEGAVAVAAGSDVVTEGDGSRLKAKIGSLSDPRRGAAALPILEVMEAVDAAAAVTVEEHHLLIWLDCE